MSAIKNAGGNIKGIGDIISAISLAFPKLSGAITAAGAAATAAGGGFAGLAAGAGALLSALSPLTIVAVAIGTAFAGFKLYNNYIDGLVDSARQAGDAWQESNTSIQDNISKITELRSALDSGKLTEQEAYDTKSQLLDIQNQLSESYGSQVEGIDLLNGAMDEQIAKIKELTDAQAEQFLTENRKGIEKARKEIEKETSSYLGESGLYSEEGQKVRGIVQKYQDKGMSIQDNEANGTFTIHFEGDAENAKAVLNDFAADVRGLQDEIGESNFTNDILDYTSSELAARNEILEEYKSLYEQAMKAEITTDKTDFGGKTATEWLNNYSQAVQDYNDAVADGNTARIAESKDFYNSMNQSVKTLLDNSEMSQYSSLFEDVGNQLDTAAIKADEFHKALSGEGTNGYQKHIKTVVDEIKRMNLSDVDFKASISSGDIESINYLSEAADKAGISTDDLTTALVELGVVSSQPLAKNAKESMEDVSTAFDEFKTRAIDVINSIQSVNAALSNSVSGSGLSVEIDDTTGKIVGDITDIQNAYKDLEGYNAEVLFEKTANGIHINREALKALQSQQEAITKQNFLKEQADLQKQLTVAIKEQQNYAQGTDGYTNAQANIDSLREQIQTVQALSSAYDGATSKFQKFLNAGSTNNERDSFESIAKSYSSMQELLNEGWVTDDSLTAYLDLMLSASQRTGDAITDFEKLGQTIEGTSHSLKDYFTFDDNGDITSEGLWNFADDVNAKLGEEYAKIDAETGQYSFDFTGEKLQEVADAFNTTPEAIELFAKAMSDANMVVRFGGDELDGYSSKMEELQKSASDAQEKLKEMQSQGEFSADIDLNFNTAEMSVDDIKSKIEELRTERIEIEASGNTEGLQAIDNEISALESQQIVMSIQAEVSEGTTVDELLSMTDEQLATTLEVDTSQVDEARSALQSLQNETMETSVTVKIDETQFSQMVTSPETSTITVDANNQPAKDNIDNAVKYGESQKIEIPVTTEPIDTSGISNGASAENGDGINVKVHVDSSEADNYVPDDKEATVAYDKDSKEPDNYQPANKSAIAKYNVNAQSVYNWTPPTKRGEVIYTVKVNGTVPHGSTDGTFASGTMISPAHASGTAYNVLNMQSVGGAYAGGNVALRKDEKALVNEEQINGHSESIVRDGKWFLIPGGAHVENLKKGDLIFSAKQTDDLLKHGKTGGHARAYAEGTIPYTDFISNSYASGLTASGYNPWNRLNGSTSISTTSSQTKSTKAYQQNTKSVEENTASQESNTEATDHSTTTLNWVERRMDIFADTVKNIADRITDYVSTAFKKSNLKKQIAAIDDEISARKHGAEVYMQVADEIASNYEYYDENGNKQSLTIPEEYKLKVQNGDWLVEEMDTSTDFNKNLAEAIQKYQEYYDSAKECTSAVQELKNNQMDLFNDLINIPIEEAEKKIDRIVAKMDVLDAAASSITGQSGLSRYSYQIEADAGMKQLSEKLDSAKTKTKSSIEEAKKAARNSGDSAVKDYIYNQIKNGKYIDTKNLTGNTKKTAEKYNTNLQNQRKVQDQYNTKKKALSDTQKLILNNEGKPTYVIQNAILGENLKNKRDESKEYANAAKQAEKNRVSTEKDLNATTKKVEKYASDMLKNNNVTKFLNASQINALKNGEEVDTTGIVDQTILQTLKNYNVLAEEKRTAEEKDTIALNTLTEAQKNATISQAEYAQMAVENEQQKFANIKDYYDSKIDYNQALQQNQESKISRKKALGASVSKSELERQRKLIENEEKLYIQQRDKLEGQLNKSVASGAIKEGSEEWKALRAEILAADTAANNAASSIANVANEIANIKLDQLEKTKSLFDAIISCCDSVVSMIETAGKYAYNDQDAMNALKGQINYYEKKANNNLESAQENYANYAAAEANNGTYGGKSSEEWLTDYYNSLTEYYNTKGNQYALDKEIRELPLQEMNGALGNLKSVLDVITSGADLKEAEGKYLDIMDYQNQIANYSEQIAKQQQINAQYQSLYEQMMAIGADARAAEYYDQWQSGVAELNKMSASVEELSDKIRDDFVESVKRSIDAISDMRDVLESELDIKKAEGKYLGYSDYSDQIRLNSQEYSNQLQIMTDRRKKYSEALLAGNQAEADQMLSEARQAEASANKLLAANAELEKSIQNLFRDTLQRELDALESAQAVLESQMNLIDAQSRDKTKDNFQQQIDMNMDLIHKQEALARENQRLYNLEVSKGNMEAAAEYLKAWKSADAEVNNLRADIESLGDDMREALLTKDIDKLLDRMEQLRNSMSTISDLINEDMMFDDNGRMTEFGITALAMDIKTYESETDSLKKLIEKRQKYIEEYNNGMNEYYSKNEYDEDMKNISQEIQEMLRDANTTRQAIVEMVAKTSKMEIDALNDVIDKRKELLQAQKDAYDFDKTLKSQTNDLTLLQKQKQALEGLTDKESQAKLQKLNKQIKEAQETLNDTIADHSFDLKIDGLDDLKQDISDAYDEYVKQLNANLEAITSTVTDATDTVVGSLGTVTEAITKLLSSYGVSGLNTDTIGYTRQYAKGTKNHPGGSAIVNDGNGLETVVLPDGSVLLPYLPKGSDVISAENTKRLLSNIATQPINAPKIETPKLDVKAVLNGNDGQQVTVGDVQININDTVDADNVMSVINKNINDIAKGVGNAFSKGVNKSSGRKNWG